MTARRLTICAIGSADSTHVAARTRCFAERGHRVFLITERRSAAPIEGVTQLVPAERGSRSHLARAVGFFSLLRRCRPDIVHVHFAYSYYGWLAGLLGCRPLAVTVMGGDILFEEQGNPTPAGRWLTIELLRQADYITSKSEHLISVLGRLGGFGAKAERIVWGVSLREFRRVETAALRNALGLRAAQRVVLSPKILQPFYRVELVVEAMALVVREVPETMLLITEYGVDSSYRAAIQARVRELKLEGNVRFCGSIPYADMPAYYSLAEMTVAMPSSDGLPQTLFEGMACETPSILSRLPRYEEIVSHRVSAYFVDATPASIAAGMIELLANKDLRDEIARHALAIVREQGNLEEQAARVEARFLELARTRARTLSPLHCARAVLAYLRFAG
jgi:glycosyltransferase involved in cell wall biosynthesis